MIIKDISDSIVSGDWFVIESIKNNTLLVDYPFEDPSKNRYIASHYINISNLLYRPLRITAGNRSCAIVSIEGEAEIVKPNNFAWFKLYKVPSGYSIRVGDATDKQWSFQFAQIDMEIIDSGHELLRLEMEYQKLKYDDKQCK